MKAIDMKSNPSRVIIENGQNTIKVEEGFIKLIEQTAVCCLGLDGMEHGCVLNIVFSDDAGIRDLNREFRKIDSSTDVLSFPMVEMSEGAIISDEGDYDLDEGFLVLGDIVISLETAERQADDYGHSFERECAFLVSHGILHLLGYDHADMDRECRMFEKQEKVLEKMGLAGK